MIKAVASGPWWPSCVLRVRHVRAHACTQLAEVEEFEDKQKELEGVAQPIISRMYQQGAPWGVEPGLHKNVNVHETLPVQHVRTLASAPAACQRTAGV